METNGGCFALGNIARSGDSVVEELPNIFASGTSRFSTQFANEFLLLF